MKNKIYKICGVALALVLVFGLAGAFVPVSVAAQWGAPAAPTEFNPGTTPNQWQRVTIPSTSVHKLRAADVGDIAVAGDGRTIYAVDTQLNVAGQPLTQGFWVLKTDTRGERWAALPPPAGQTWGGLNPRLIAVAPDDPNAVAVVDSFAAAAGPPATALGRVWISNNGGTTWAVLNAVPGNATPSAVVTDIEVGPARSGTIMGRDYVVTVADGGAAAMLGGDILFMGFNTNWTSVAATDTNLIIAANDLDFTSVVMSPGWLGDRCFAAVGSTDGSAVTAAGTYLFIVQTTDAPAPACTTLNPPGAVEVEVTATTTFSPIDFDAAAAVGTSMVKSDIALPADFDPTIVPGRRVYIGWTAVGVASFDDVYRVDNTTVRKLQTGANVANGIWSIAYCGTCSSGTLIAGEGGPTSVNTVFTWHTEDPNVSQPSWAANAKAPTGRANCVVGIDAADPLLCYAGTSGVESAFSASTDGAYSFNSRSLINTEIDVIQDAMPTPNGSLVFMATSEDGIASVWPNLSGRQGFVSAGSDMESLWVSKTPPTGQSWERVRMSPNNIDWGDVIGGSIVRLSPEYDTIGFAGGAGDSTLYWCNAGGVGIERSTDGGNVFSSRVGPAGVGIADVTLQNADTLYLGDNASSNVYKSTNGAWFFDQPVSASIAGNVWDLEMVPSYPAKPMPGPGMVLVGGTTATSVSYSPKGGAFFIPVTPFIGGGVGANANVYADEDYSNNKLIYCAATVIAGAPGGLRRFALGTSTVWEQIRGAVAGQPMTGVVEREGVLYGSWGAVVGGAAATPLIPGDTFAITEPVGAAGDAGNITVVTGSVRITPVTAGPVLLVNGVALPAIVTAGQTATYTIPAASAPLTDFIQVESLTANTNGTWTAALITTVGAITVNTSGTAWATTGLPGGSFSLPAAEVPAAGPIVGVGASGAQRTLYPTVGVAAMPWQNLTVGAIAGTGVVFNSTPDAVSASGLPANVVWAVDTGNVALMAYYDTMSTETAEVTVPAEVPIDSVTGRNQQFTITWGQVSNGNAYFVEIYTDPACTQFRWDPTGLGPSSAWVPSNPLMPTCICPANTLVAGEEYFLKVRCCNQVPLDANWSHWSSVHRFSVQGGEQVTVTYLGVQPLGPVPGATDVPRSPGFTWSPYAKCTRYEFQLAKDAGMTDIIDEAKLSTTGYKYEGTLDYKTTYFWRARGIEPTVTDWSPLANFTTEAKPVPAPAPPAPAPPVEMPPPIPSWVLITIIIIGAVLVIAVIVLIVRTRRVS